MTAGGDSDDERDTVLAALDELNRAIGNAVPRTQSSIYEVACGQNQARGATFILSTREILLVRWALSEVLKRG